MKKLLAVIAISLCALVSGYAQTSALAPDFKPQYLDKNGRPCSGCKIWTYSSGTSNPLKTYKDKTGLTENSNPIVLDSAGRASIWLGPWVYRAVMEKPPFAGGGHGVVEWTVDGYSNTGQTLRRDLADVTTGLGADLVGYKRNANSTVARTVDDELQGNSLVNVANYAVPSSTVTNQIDSCLADPKADICVIPNGTGAGDPTSIPAGKLILDFRGSSFCLKTSASVSACKLSVSGANGIQGLNGASALATMPTITAGSLAPTSNCVAGAELYWATTPQALYVCSATNTWTQVPTGSAPTWHKYSLVAIASGVNGCANANGCWQVNGVLGANKAAGLSQDVTLFQLPAGGHLSECRIKSSTAATGPSTVVTGLGVTGSNVLYRAATYDLKAAVANTNLTACTAASPYTAAAVNVVASIVTTGSNVELIAAGTAIDYWIMYAVLP